ncbi:pyruvate, water dikinase regulatory protein [Paenibacillus sp. GCM10027626]|uniref:pyruvate, water dikinase regulatory protein n=1 Tax=Paenibacillus sp. GCM10027626 TaxID=3273411 RepID=UPI003636DBB5
MNREEPALGVGSNRQIFICSDAIGETAETVVRASMRQFAFDQIKLKRYGHIRNEDEIVNIVEEAARCRGFIAYTLVQPELREMMKEESVKRGVRAVDVMGPMMQAFIDTFNDSPKRQPGLRYTMDDDYFRKIDAMEFAVNYDDGKDMRGLQLAQIVLIGVSRTSKTPMCIYLAHKGIRAANLPLVPEMSVPAELMTKRDGLIVGLTMDPEKLASIRSERLLAMGLPQGSRYASVERILEELTFAEKVMKELGCEIIDVTSKSIEETSGLILARYTEGAQHTTI